MSIGETLGLALLLPAALALAVGTILLGIHRWSDRRNFDTDCRKRETPPDRS